MVEPSYAELAALVVELTGRLERADAQIAALRVEVAGLRAKAGKGSNNSSIPPSQDGIGSKATRKAVTSQRVRSVDRKRGGQPGHHGSGLRPTVDPDRVEQVEAVVECRGCGADLTDGMDAGSSWAQVWDTMPIVVEKVHYVLPRRRCVCCRTLSTATPPFGQAGTVNYGPNVNAAAILLASQANVPVEATAALMTALLAVPVSTGFIARAHARFADRLVRQTHFVIFGGDHIVGGGSTAVA